MNIRSQGSISDNTAQTGKYAIAEREREKHIDAILNSPSSRKIVVGGPGTGKTHLFESILKGKRGTLTLTFVNALVEDLSLEFCGLSVVRTLHSFARGIMKKATQRGIDVFPKLSKVIKEDARILLNEDIDFDHLFHNRTAENRHIEFYKKRKNYYKHYGFSDIIFAAVRLLEQDRGKIPKFSQVLVDEFQDFNALEVGLIDLLAEKSPILLVGDDDQALYESLKSASARHIRQRHSGEDSGYAAFCLPYCSRCTRVIVDAVDDIIRGAKEHGYLAGRICKPFRYFESEEKDRDSNANAKLTYAQLFHAKIPWFIQKCIEEIAEQVRDKFTVLIISPTNVLCKCIAEALNDKGFKSVQLMEKEDTKEPTLLDGLKLLLRDRNCNLGWRIVAKEVLEDTDFATLLKESDKDNAKRVSNLIAGDQKGKVTQMLRVLRALRDRNQIQDETELAGLLKKLGHDPYARAKDNLKDEIKSCRPGALEPSACKPEVTKIPITTTTIQKSKGLEADYVFMTHFDDQYFIKHRDKSKVSDEDICKFVVVLTRARRKVFLISSDTKRRPLLLNWIDKRRICEVLGDG
jgi:superfamily I DNA/RNA helicase